jgi:hypothetical protein
MWERRLARSLWAAELCLATGLSVRWHFRSLMPQTARASRPRPHEPRQDLKVETLTEYISTNPDPSQCQ